MVSCIDEHRDRFGVEPICKVLPIAPSTYYTHQSVQQDPERRSARAKRDNDLTLEIQRVWDDNFGVYGVRKVWRQLKREGHVVARCTVARLMRELGLRGVVRGRRMKTTVPDELLERPLDRVNRQFNVSRPNALWVADLTYVATGEGLSTWHLSLTLTRGALSVGAYRAHCTQASPWTRWSRRCTTDTRAKPRS